jgi:nitroreductase
MNSKKSLKRKPDDRLVPFLKNVRNVYRIIKGLLIELYDLRLRYYTNPSDRDFLGYTIRNNAHRLEKIIKKLHSNSSTDKRYGQILSKNLEYYLSQWYYNAFELDDTIKWAEKIHFEYQQYIGAKFNCIMNHKARVLEKFSNLLDVIKTRRSIRKWKKTRIDLSILHQLVDAGRWAPSSCNRQTSRFIAIDNDFLKRKISRTVKGGRTFFANAPLLLMVLNDIRPYDMPYEKYILYQDGAAAIQNMLLMAHSLGLGACWGAYTSNSGIILNEKYVRRLLGIPHYYKISGILAIGKPDEAMCQIPRRDIGDICFLNYFVEY